MNTNSTATAAKLQIAPYIFFYGRCEEALEFYKTAIGGTYEMQRNSEAPEGMPVDASLKDKVMHATFTGSGITFMASDGREIKTVDPDAGNISLSLAATEADEGERVFKALAEGGKVAIPLAEAFWGGRFGDVVDKFGIEWMIVTP